MYFLSPIDVNDFMVNVRHILEIKIFKFFFLKHVTADMKTKCFRKVYGLNTVE